MTAAFIGKAVGLFLPLKEKKDELAT